MANEKRLIDAAVDSGGETAKIKTHHARIVVDGTAEKPYYSIEWFDPTKKEYYLGYSSYFIGNVFKWLEECFEIVDAPTVDAVEVVRCKDCKHSACNPVKLTYACRHPSGLRGFVHEGYYFCSYGERREGE